LLTEVVRSLYRYNTWANARILEAAGKATSAQLREAGGVEGNPARVPLPTGASFESVHETLVHTLAAQWLYLERWQGRSPRAMPEPAQFAGLAAIHARWEIIERDTQVFLGTLDDARLGATIAYTNFQGERWAYPLWQQMIHQVNHATQHRSEAAMLLTKHGHSPGLLDYLYFIDVEAAGST
jgi:uncharacterized damage-inducible protein DinB